ncbi:MAG: hypothetical protein LQ337_003700 [Flavoplaca oasis]|nr:MAG: hypothetical protein LQ337_003700 [Flavoplaca oasis]
MFRCTKCGRHCCKPCWDSKGGDGRHTVHDQGRLAYTGPKAEPLPPVVGEVRKVDGRRKGKSEDKKDGSQKGDSAADGEKVGERKKTLIVSLKTGKAKKRSREGESAKAKEDDAPTADSGLAEGSAAAEHKRRRRASGGYSASPPQSEQQRGTPRKAISIAPKTSIPLIKTPPRSSNANKRTPSRSSSKATFGSPNQTPKRTTPRTSNAPKVAFSSMSPITKILTQSSPQRQQEQSYNLDDATEKLISFGQDLDAESSTDASDTERDEDDYDNRSPRYAASNTNSTNKNMTGNDNHSSPKASPNAKTMQTNSMNHSQNHKVAIESVTKAPHRHNGVDTLLSAAHMLDNHTPTHTQSHAQNLPASSPPTPASSSLLRRAKYVSPSREEVDEEAEKNKKNKELTEQRKKMERQLRMLGEES